MGICISSASSEIHQADDGLENVMHVQEDIGSHGVEKRGSLYSKEGSKGVNQDAAVVHQGYGMEHGAFCGVFDGHGKNGHIVSRTVRNRLPSLLLNQKNALGDSRAVMGRTNDQKGILPVQLTTDLKPGVPSEARRIRQCNGRVLALKEEPHVHRVWLPHEDSPGLAMSRAFGDFLLKNHGIIALPDISYHRVTPKDQFVVLASDGVWDVLSNKEVVSIVSAADSEQAAAKAVVEAATAAWKRKFTSSKVDDCTVVCLFLQTRK